MHSRQPNDWLGHYFRRQLPIPQTGPGTRRVGSHRAYEGLLGASVKDSGPKSHKWYGFGIRNLKYWVLGPPGIDIGLLVRTPVIQQALTQRLKKLLASSRPLILLAWCPDPLSRLSRRSPFWAVPLGYSRLHLSPSFRYNLMGASQSLLSLRLGGIYKTDWAHHLVAAPDKHGHCFGLATLLQQRIAFLGEGWKFWNTRTPSAYHTLGRKCTCSRLMPGWHDVIDCKAL